MTIANAAGQTYVGPQVSFGGTMNFGPSTMFTQTGGNVPDTLTIGMIDGATVQFSYQSPDSTLSGYGTVIANTDAGFVFSYIDGTDTTNFYVSNDPQNDLPGINVVSLPNESSAPVYQAPCYCPGTLIRTDRGDVPVEELAVGDRLVTVGGAVEAIRWIGTRAYAGRFFRANPDVWPVRFRAGSLGTDAGGGPVPSRDLLVSPKHAMLIDGVLVAAELLVDGDAIVRDGGAGAVAYIHVELPRHDAIWAENAASETFADDGSRAMFHNAGTYAAMYPGAGDVAPEFCAPRVDGGPMLDAIRRRLSIGRGALHQAA